jgi:hypothetical protein
MLNDEDLVGSPALKTYQSFVSPRDATFDHALEEALDPAAKRTANQVQLFVRLLNCCSANVQRGCSRE